MERDLSDHKPMIVETTVRMVGMARYQNISTVTTSVVRKAANGDFRTVTVRPGMIVELTPKDVEMTKDGYRPRENNPFETGMIAPIPKGASTHPDAPDMHRNPTTKQAQDAVKVGVDEVEKLAARVGDYRGVLIIRRALDAERNAITDSQYSEMQRILDRRTDMVERIQRENEQKFKLTT